MPRPSGLRIKPRYNKTGQKTGYTITGTVADERVRKRAQSLDLKLVQREVAILEAEILGAAWHGQRRGVHSFAEGVLKYYEVEPRNAATKARYARILQAMGDVKLGDIDQDMITKLRDKLLRPDHRPATLTREIIAPIRAVMRLAEERGWCTAPHFRTARELEGRTLYLLPDEAERLIAAAAPHLQPLIVFLFATGARMGEAIYLDWDDRSVDLAGGQVIFFADQTKAKKRRVVDLPPRAVGALANLPHREGAVFRRPDRLPYIDRRGRYGGQVKSAFAAAVRRAGLNPAITPHICRHTWATWHYAMHKDPLLLKQDGGWSSLALVERYAKLMPKGYESEIQRFFGHLSGNAAADEGHNRLIRLV